MRLYINVLDIHRPVFITLSPLLEITNESTTLVHLANVLVLAKLLLTQ